MAVDERRRGELIQAVESVVGTEHAMTLSDLLPPSDRDPATQQAVDLRFDLVDQRLELIDQRFLAIDDRFRAMEHRFDSMEHRFADLRADVLQRCEQTEHRVVEMGDRLGTRFDDRLDDRLGGLRHELLAAFRGEIAAAVSGQARAVLLGVLTTVLGIGGLAIALSQLL